MRDNDSESQNRLWKDWTSSIQILTRRIKSLRAYKSEQARRSIWEQPNLNMWKIAKIFLFHS